MFDVGGGADTGVGDAVAAAIVDGGPLPTIVLDTAGAITRVNRAACALFGRTSDELVGQSASILVAEQDVAGVEARIVEAATRTGRHLEMEARTATGTIPIGFSVAPLEVDGVRLGLILVGRDVSERLAVERELAELAASTRALSNSSEIGMYRFDFEPHMHLAEANPAFAAILGYPAEVLLATHRRCGPTCPSRSWSASGATVSVMRRTGPWSGTGHVPTGPCGPSP